MVPARHPFFFHARNSYNFTVNRTPYRTLDPYAPEEVAKVASVTFRVSWRSYIMFLLPGARSACTGKLDVI